MGSRTGTIVCLRDRRGRPWSALGRSKLRPYGDCAAAAAVIAIAVVVAQPFRAAVLSAQTPTTNWAQFRGNPHLTGVTTAEPPATLTLKWTFDAGDSIESSAAVVDGSV